MRDYRYDRVHLHSPDPDATARGHARGISARHDLSRAAAHFDEAGRPDRADRAARPHAPNAKTPSLS